jgi:GrpB-like predicted nucleotidyltransferase (UPF0157 family)
VRDAFHEPVTLSEPDPAWRHHYAEEAARIQRALAALEPVVDHVGSTSVPLRGKPIIDIQLAVPEAAVGEAVVVLQRLGYEHHGQGGVAGREYMTRRSSHSPAINVHVFAAANPLLDDNRVIRDYLRAHSDAAAEYAAVKQRALDQGHADLLSYSDCKRAHLAALRDSAHRWRRGAAHG